MYPNYPNQPPRMGGPRRPPGYSNQPPRISGYFVQPNQPPRIVGYSGRPLMNQGYPNQYTRNIPRVPMQMAPGLISRQAHSDANCDACFDMNPRLRPQSEHTFLGPNRIMVILPKFLEASEYNNCPFCTILLDLFMAFVDNAEEKVSHAAQMDITRGSTRRLPRASVFLESGKPIEVHFREGKHATSVSYPPIQIYNPADGPRSNWSGLSALRNPDQELDNDLQFFRNQINNCVNNHARCAQSSLRSLPKRLLDLGTSDRDVVKLVESSSVYMTEKYAAVSHRWCDKSVPMLITTKQAYQKHTKGISTTDMPAVLNDSIRVTRNLGLRYLWMDTLCLIQDDNQDKEEELPKMGAYYANAHFTIAASSSRDSRESFLKLRDEIYAPGELQFGDDANSVVLVRRSGLEGHLAKRGWIWQESALSTRVLNFAPSELIWECKSQVLSECGYEPRNAPSLGLARHFYDVEQQPFALWQQLVQSYSARELTQYTDVLPAISGLAQRVRDITGSEYYAGIWGNNIAPSLLWEVPRVTIEGTRPKVPAKYTAPSWSWASIEGCVRTSDSSMGGSSKHAGVTYSTGSVTVDTSFSAMTHVVQIGRVECTVSSKNENPFGAVTGGYIELTSLVLLATLYYKKKFPSGAAYLLEHPAISDKLLPFSPDTELEPFIIRRSRPPMFSVRRSNSIPSQEYRVDVECLMISKGPGATARSVTVDGIVLARSQTNGSQRIRIGFFSFGNASWFLHATQNQTVTIV